MGMASQDVWDYTGEGGIGRELALWFLDPYLGWQSFSLIKKLVFIHCCAIWCQFLMFQDFESTVPTVMLNYLTLLCCTLLSAHRHTQMNLGTCTGRRRRECIRQFRIFGNTVLAATVYDCFSFKSFDPSFHSPGAFSAMGTENCVVILVCNTKNWEKKKKSIFSLIFSTGQ